MTGDPGGILPSLAILAAFALAALYLTLTRGWADARPPAGAIRAGAAVVLVQAAHFTEELSTGFHVEFPALFGAGPISPRLFAAFNVGCLLIWSASLWGLHRRRRAALFPLWFLAIAGCANGVLHPLAAAATRAYFPGLATSPLLGAAGALLLRRLLSVTAGRRSA